VSDDYGLMKTGDEQVFLECMMEFSSMQLWRNTTASQWEEIAQLIDPNSRNTFYYGNYNWPGVKKTDRQVDASGMVALHRFGAICDSLLTPRNMQWHQLGTTDETLNKDRRVKEWFETATRLLFQKRYAPVGNFSAQNQNSYQSLGAYGTQGMFIDQAVNEASIPVPYLRYKQIPIGELFIRENHQGLVNAFIRWFRLTPEQAWTKWGDKCPESIKTARDAHSQTPFNFLHWVRPRTDWDPGRLDAKGMPFVSHYVSIEGCCVLQEGGYRTFPLACSRYIQSPGEVYGRSPAMLVLPALKTLNAEKTTFLKQGHRAADPVLLTADDGLVDISLRPGALNKGGMSADGHPLIGILPTGQIQINKEMMDEERSLINDIFLVSLFQILTETPAMSATEVIERTNEKGILIAPTLGRQQSEYLGPMIERELALMVQMRQLPPMPQLLREAQGEYEVVYTSPLAKAARAQEAAGFMRTLQTATEVANVTQDPSIFDRFDFDTAIPAIADIQGTPITWMADDKAVAAKRQNRSQAAAQQQQIQAAPAAAAMLKAHVAAATAGVQVPGQPAPGQPAQPVQQQGPGQPPQGQ